MRFPLPLTLKIAGYIIKHKIRRTPKFAQVLQLEPLHTCNLACTGCGRVREYSTSLKDIMSLVDCLGAAEECDAPMISICGGEPLIYPQIEQLVEGLLKQNRIVYICTNAILLRRKLREYLTAEMIRRPRYVEPILGRLISEGLITAVEAEEIKKGPKDSSKPVIAPSRWMYWNIHLDGMERTHDLIVEREGVFKEAILAIRMAKLLGYQVATNTTVYKETDMSEIEELFSFLGTLNIDGHTISPGYDFDDAKQDMIKRLNKKPEDFYLTRALTAKKFAKIEEWSRRFPFFGTPIYFEFLAGKRDLTCSAWAIPTRNVRGWRAPCYAMADGHYASYSEVLKNTQWENYGVIGGKARDPRCENCMIHCGYEPTASLGFQSKPGDTWKNIAFNFRSRPASEPCGTKVNAFNGVSSGNGHVTGGEAKPVAVKC